ncbi:hypothetical protein DP939_42865 [Spongiactinospora rosea]|uniref:Uncharacterized protein n=1 Tax=Spongiactinospora rosea TaxID=2248750 RepID=A0A366LLI5_9ACTN|nr:hypothetical protein DP939_42865 [Spongiactinospora rosea]
MITEHLQWLIGQDGHPWIHELSVIAVEQKLTNTVLRDVVSDVAWLSRDAGEPIPEENKSIPSGVDRDVYRLVEMYAVAQRLRFDFLFQQLYDRCRAWLSETSDALILSCAAMAAMGLRHPDGLDLYKKAIEAPDADKVVRHVALTAVWIGQHIPEQASLMLSLCSDMISKGENDANLYFRRCRAWTRLARYEEALDDIFRAMHMLGHSQNAIHQDYVREWQIILSHMEQERSLKTVVEKYGDEVRERALNQVDDITKELDEKLAKAERLVAENQLQLVQILGLFVALAAFLIGGGVTIGQASGWIQGLITIAGLAVGSLLFFAMLRWTIQYKRNN